jgi:hypothetical protein
MTYLTPELTLIGQASGVVLSGNSNKDDATVTADFAAALEAEW